MLKGALLASCLSSTSAWPDVLNNGRDKPWSVRALWFSGLVFALFAVMIAGLQSMRLHRLSSHRDGLRKIRAGFARRRGPNGYAPERFQLYAWEASQAFLVLSVLLMVIGIAVLVWVSTEYGPNKPRESGWWDENSKVSHVVLLWIVLLQVLTNPRKRWPSLSLPSSRLPLPFSWALSRHSAARKRMLSK